MQSKGETVRAREREGGGERHAARCCQPCLKQKTRVGSAEKEKEREKRRDQVVGTGRQASREREREREEQRAGRKGRERHTVPG